MKKLLFLAASLLLVTALPALRPPLAKLRFAPAAGSKLTRTIENKSEFSLDDMSMKMNGQDSPMMPEIEMTMSQTQKVVVTDEFTKMREGSPKLLRRSFDTLESEMSSQMKIDIMGQKQDQNHSGKGASELAGKTVVFTWDDDAKEYKTAFDPAESKTELLKGLQEDMDLRVLLPDGEVKEGEEWEIDVKQLAKVIAPGGDLKIKPDEKAGGDSPMGMGDMSGMSGLNDWLGESMEGTAKGKFTGMRTVDGHAFAVVSIDIKAKGAKDLTEISRAAMEKAKREGMTMEMKSVDVEFELGGQGELLWDVEAGHVHSLEFSGPSSAKIDISIGLEMQGTKMDIEQGMELSGTTTLKYKAE